MPEMKVLADLVGDSPGIRVVRDTVARLLARQQEVRRLPSILIQGETGTGKGLLARMIHRAGPRPDGPFIDVNCAAIPDTLLEAEMFGFERGAFTDARRSKAGLFQAAHRGTIFLDEVGLLPEGLQAKLLKVLEDRTIRRLGATRDEPVDVWVLTATNEDLKSSIRERRFREDLYHRLAVLTVTLPPLRERGADLVTLAEHFLSRVSGEYGVPGKSLAADARAALNAYRWPGNVRELSNVIERAVLMSSANEITAEALGLGDAAAPPPAAPPEAPVSLDDAMRGHLVEVLTQTKWNISRTAALLGISRNTLRARMDKYALRERDTRPASRPRPTPAPARAAAPVTTAIAPALAPLALPPPPTARRWERRRLALLRVALVPSSSPNAPLETARALETVVEKVRTFGGSVEGIGPIGLIAAFGLAASGEVSDRAAHVAMAIVKAVERARLEQTADLGVRIGLHASMVLVGLGAGAPELDMEERRDLWPLLDELVERARINSVTVSAVAAPLLTRRFELAAGPGLAGGAPTYQLVGRERTGLGLGSGLVAFVGRRHELDLLEDRLQSATRAHSQLVGIVGEAGIGKSRLIYEFRQTAAGRDVDYMEAHCLSYGSAVPFLPMLDLVRGCCHLAESEPPEVTADKIRRVLEDLGLDAAELAPYLLHVLGIKDDPGRLDVVSHEALKTRVFEILRQVLRRRTRRRPLVLVVEDLHWIDTSSEEFFESLVDGLTGAPMLLIATYRSGYRPRWIEKSYATQIPLQPLDPSEARRVVRAVLRDSPVPEAVVDLLLAKAEGNAFFLQELALVVREAGDLASPVVVPDTVQDVLLTRIDRLLPDERDVLTSAAVVGKDFPLSVVQAIVVLPPETVRRTLARLEAAEFVHETGMGADVEYTFKHTLTHEVAYDCVRGSDRRRLHAGVLAALEALREEPASEHLERLAHHAARAAIWDKAYGYLRQAGARAHVAGAHREAVAFFEQALAALAELPSSRERLEQAIDVRFELRTSLLPLGEVERGLDHLREAARLASELGDPHRLGRLTIYHVGQLYFMGEHERAWEVGQQALRLGDTLDDLALRTSTNTYLGQVLHARGEYRQAADFFRKNAEALRGATARERLGLPQLPAVHSRACLVWSLAELGEFREAVARAQEGVALAEGVNQPLSRTVAYAGLGVVWLRQGEYARAITVLERGLDLIREWNIPLWFPRVASALGAALARGGRASEAHPLLEQAVERATAMKLLGGLSLLVGYQAQTFLVLEDLEAAAAAAAQALGLARHHGERGYEAMALRLVGEAALARGEAGAEPTLDEARALAEALAMRPLLAECHVALAVACERRAEATAAAAHRAAARAIVAATGMHPIA
jgi:transcriptional regulator with AAA-type ATPase domain/tetratricopeptide (TPR) repeat protein